MATADEIRQRVEQADRDRMAARQDAAADVAGKRDQRQALREQLEQAERDLAQSVAAAEQVMNRRELAGFLDVKQSDVEQWATAGSSRTRQRSSGSGKRSSRSRSSRSRTAGEPAGTASEAASTGAATAAPGAGETVAADDSTESSTAV